MMMATLVSMSKMATLVSMSKMATLVPMSKMATFGPFAFVLAMEILVGHLRLVVEVHFLVPRNLKHGR